MTMQLSRCSLYFDVTLLLDSDTDAALSLVLNFPAVWHPVTPRAVWRLVQVAFETRRAVMTSARVFHEGTQVIGWDKEFCLDRKKMAHLYDGRETKCILKEPINMFSIQN